MEKIKITFWHRSAGYDWPPYMTTLEFDYERPRCDPYMCGFEAGGYSFEYDESVTSNGWWARRPGYEGSCRIFIKNEEILK